MGFAEIEMRAYSGGANQISGGTPSANTSYSGSYDATKAVDADVNTSWLGTGTAGTWWQYTFAGAVQVSEVAIRCRSATDGAGTAANAPTDFYVEWYDGSAWQIAWHQTASGWSTGQQKVFTQSAAPEFFTTPTITGNAWVGQVLTCNPGTFSGESFAYQWKRDGSAISGATSSTYTLVSGDATHAITCTVTATNWIGSTSSTSNSSGTIDASAPPTSTQWRLNFTTKQGGSGNFCSVAELEFRGTAGGADQTTGATGTALSNYDSSNNAPKAFDNNTATRWLASSNAMPQWVQATMASAVAVKEVAVTSYNAGDAPTAFDVQYYDGSTWQTYWSPTTAGTWTNGETRVFTKP